MGGGKGEWFVVLTLTGWEPLEFAPAMIDLVFV